MKNKTKKQSGAATVAKAESYSEKFPTQRGKAYRAIAAAIQNVSNAIFHDLPCWDQGSLYQVSECYTTEFALRCVIDIMTQNVKQYYKKPLSMKEEFTQLAEQLDRIKQQLDAWDFNDRKQMLSDLKAAKTNL
jgi:hypothetical protein